MLALWSDANLPPKMVDPRPHAWNPGTGIEEIKLQKNFQQDFHTMKYYASDIQNIFSFFEIFTESNGHGHS